jgi:hypothetical protein
MSLELPKEFITSPVLLLTATDIADDLQFSREWVYKLKAKGIIVPQRLTAGGLSLFEPEYWEWAKTNVPTIDQRMSDLALE